MAPKRPAVEAAEGLLTEAVLKHVRVVPTAAPDPNQTAAPLHPPHLSGGVHEFSSMVV
jgi:hypothetical protein